MDIRGAIFDCDGTLVDSMGMWGRLYDWAYAHYGTPSLPLDQIESLSLYDTCALFHQRLGMGASPKAVYEELCAHVREAYRSEVRCFDGVRRFLDELAAAGVPMIVASSTPVREVRCCLEAHNLTGYFQDVVSTEDVGGRDKEFPDVYNEALRRLGTPRKTTWVFEDAPFGVQTSRKAGFAVCGLMNDHDGRREEDVRPWCDLYVHGYAELSLGLIHDYERPAASTAGTLRALIVDGSPEPSAPALVRALADAADYVVCADGGADVCRAAGVVPQVFCGDVDSASPEAAAWAEGGAKTQIIYPSEKYATDLALAIGCAEHEAARRAEALELTLTCCSGGRPDHALAVVGLLASAHAASARIVEDGYEMRVVSAAGTPRWELPADAAGRTFSVVAVAPGTRVDLAGLKWELADKPLELLGDLGISNVVESAAAAVSVRSGAAAAYLIGAPLGLS